LGNAGITSKRASLIRASRNRTEQEEFGALDAREEKRWEELSSTSRESAAPAPNGPLPVPPVPPYIPAAPGLNETPAPTPGIGAEIERELQFRRKRDNAPKPVPKQVAPVDLSQEVKQPLTDKTVGLIEATEYRANCEAYANRMPQEWRLVTWSVPACKQFGVVIVTYLLAMWLISHASTEKVCAEVSKQTIGKAVSLMANVVPLWLWDVESWRVAATDVVCTVVVTYPNWYLWPYVQLAAAVYFWAVVELRFVVWKRTEAKAVVRSDGKSDGRIAIMRNIRSQKPDVVVDYVRTIYSTRFIFTNHQRRHVSVVQAAEAIRGGLGGPDRVREEIDKFIKFNTGVHTSAFDAFSPDDTAMFVVDLQLARSAEHYSDFSKPPVAACLVGFLAYATISAVLITAIGSWTLFTLCLSWPTLLWTLFSWIPLSLVSVITHLSSVIWVAASGGTLFLILIYMTAPTCTQQMFTVLHRFFLELISSVLGHSVTLCVAGSERILIRWRQVATWALKHGWKDLTTLSGDVMSCFEHGTGVAGF